MSETNALIGWAPDLGTPTTFVLMRHGVTPLTADMRFSGDGGSDPSLTDEGFAQVERAAGHLAAADRLVAALGRRAPFSGIDAVVASPMQRTRQSADVVAKRLGLDVELEPAVRECGFGDWDGLTYAEVEERWPDELAAWLASPSYAPPNGESFDEVHARVVEARVDLAKRYQGRTVLVASHVTPIKSFVRDVLAAPSAALFRMELVPASISVVQWYADGIGSLRTFNDTAHLTR